MTEFNNYGYQHMLEVFRKTKENDDKKRLRFERDLFVVLAIIAISIIAILVSCIRIENYLKEITNALMVIAYAS